MLKKLIKWPLKKLFDYGMRKRGFNRVLNLIRYLARLEKLSYAQNAEDIVIEQLVGDKQDGIYVDIGAHHPVRFSNTYKLYLRGWHGINIDPLPRCMEYFDEYRPNDINLNVGISATEGIMSYYDFVEPAYNTFSDERARIVIENGYTKLKQKIDVKTERMETVLDKYLRGGYIIDVLTIDVETCEHDVLVSNNWEKYRPQLIVMESLVSCNASLDRIYDDPNIAFLVEKGYMAVAKMGNAVFLKTC